MTQVGPCLDFQYNPPFCEFVEMKARFGMMRSGLLSDQRGEDHASENPDLP
jgi:hypothetical protein